MAVIRVNHTENYTVMSNCHLQDTNLSLKAKGLLSQMLSLPTAWDYTVAGLVSINREKKSAITAALNELKQYGYLVVTKLMPNETDSGRFEYVYDVYEQPQEKQGIEKQDLEFQGVEFQGVEIQGIENRPQLNTYNKVLKEESTYELSTDNKDTPLTPRKRETNIPPTLEEVSAYCRERGNNVDPEQFYDHYEAKGWMIGRTKMKDFKAAIRNWERDDRRKVSNNGQSDGVVEHSKEWWGIKSVPLD